MKVSSEVAFSESGTETEHSDGLMIHKLRDIRNIVLLYSQG